ncbi:MAG: DUF6088 family protein [Thermosynechococcaceae cyanobacterium]
MKQSQNLEQKIALRIAESEQEVFLRKDFEDLGSYSQIGRCLRNLIKKEKLIKIGQGLYAKATIGPLWDQVIPRRGIDTITREALSRLGVETVPSSAERRYNNGESTQVPTGRVIGVKKRISRKIGYNGMSVTFERV